MYFKGLFVIMKEMQSGRENVSKEEYQIRRLERRVIKEGSALDFLQDTMQLPNGRIEQWDFVHHRRGGGAAIVPLLPDGRILMIRQYRPAIDQETLELPAGARECPDEDGAVTARRELREETGYDCEELMFLTKLRTAVSWCDETTEVYLARGLSRCGEQILDDAEEIRLVPMERSELIRMIFRGEIQDAKTVAGVMASEVYIE